MNARSDFLRWFRREVFTVFAVGILSGCSYEKNTPDSCKQASLEAWTDEFIESMNAGYLPDEANKIAEVLSDKTLAQCIDEQKVTKK